MLWRKGNTETALASTSSSVRFFLIPTKNTITMKVQHDILAAFERGERLTVQKAFRLFHTTELRKIVSRLRRRGYDIRSNRKTAETEDGRAVTYNEYFLCIE